MKVLKEEKGLVLFVIMFSKYIVYCIVFKVLWMRDNFISFYFY